MKVLVALVVVLASVYVLAVPLRSEAAARAQFKHWMLQHSKSYKSAQEQESRFQNFYTNLQYHAKMNKLNPQAHYGPSKFSDLSRDEFRSLYLSKPITPQMAVTACLATGVDQSREFRKAGIAIPTTYNLTLLNKVTPIKDQGQCGSCWAFSTTGAIESAYLVKNKKNATDSMSLSEQAIVDCSTGCAPEDGQQVCNQGCDGGWPWSAIVDLIGWGGLPTETAYPYTAQDGTCSISGKSLILKPTNYSCLSGPNQSGGPADETTQMPTVLMARGALSIALNADLFFDYTSGIINPSDPADNCETTQLDHAVLLVGWGSEGGVDYWIIKNSWGLSWGENGYVRMARGVGLCGLNNAVSSIIF